MAAGASAQDTIVRKNGDRIACTITSEDSSSIYFTVLRNNKDIQTSINKSEVASVVKEVIIRNYYRPDVSALGVGFGFDYGGIGINFLTYLQKNIGIFAGVGYALAGFGVNGGLKLRIVSDSAQTALVMPYVMGMYGYNTAVHVKNAEALDKFFYGPTFGAGLDIRFKPKGTNYLSFALTFPVRGKEVDNYIYTLKTFYGVDFKNSLSAVGFSIGLKTIVY